MCVKTYSVIQTGKNLKPAALLKLRIKKMVQGTVNEKENTSKY